MELMPNEHVRLKLLLTNDRCCLLCLGEWHHPFVSGQCDNAVISATEVTAFAFSTNVTSIVGEHYDQNPSRYISSRPPWVMHVSGFKYGSRKPSP